MYTHTQSQLFCTSISSSQSLRTIFDTEHKETTQIHHAESSQASPQPHPIIPSKQSPKNPLYSVRPSHSIIPSKTTLANPPFVIESISAPPLPSRFLHQPPIPSNPNRSILLHLHLHRTATTAPSPKPTCITRTPLFTQPSFAQPYPRFTLPRRFWPCTVFQLYQCCVLDTYITKPGRHALPSPIFSFLSLYSGKKGG